MTSFSTQYQPMHTTEKAADDAVSVRQLRDLADGMNNAVVTCAPRWVAMAWPGDRPVSVDGTTETVILRNVGPVNVSNAYNRLTWSAGMKLSGAGTCTWKLYSHQWPYIEVDAITSALEIRMGLRETSTIATTSTMGETPTVLSHVLNAPPNGLVYLTLSATNTAGGYTCALDSFAATPWISEA